MACNRPFLFAAPALAVAAPLLTGATDPGASVEDRLLLVQNRERAALGIAPLFWNDRLAASARQWAVHLAATGRFEHAPEKASDPEGENLWAGTRGAYAPEQMVAAWAREKRYFKAGRFPDNSTTGDYRDVGHYTQLMWRRTREVGCATARGGVEDVLVCRYSQAGNYVGDVPF